MPIPQTILDYLDEHGVSYSQETRAMACTRETSRLDDLSGKNVAKTVIFSADDELLMAVLNENRVVDMQEMKRLVGCDTLSLASEKELSDKFGFCEPASIPPFGTLFRIPTYCDRMLAQQSEIEFCAGTTNDLVRMAFSEFVQIEAPTMADFSAPTAPGKRAA